MATTRKDSPDFTVTSDDYEAIYNRPIAEALDDDEALKAYSEGMAKLRQELADIQIILDSIHDSRPEVNARKWMRVLRVEHRTHQASIIRFLRALLKEYSKNEYFDDRNKGAVDFAKKASEIDAYIPYI